MDIVSEDGHPLQVGGCMRRRDRFDLSARIRLNMLWAKGSWICFILYHFHGQYIQPHPPQNERESLNRAWRATGNELLPEYWDYERREQDEDMFALIEASVPLGSVGESLSQ